jgi:hypothetical protein
VITALNNHKAGSFDEVRTHIGDLSRVEREEFF